MRLHNFILAFLILWLIGCAGSRQIEHSPQYREQHKFGNTDPAKYFLVFILETAAIGYENARGYGYLMHRISSERIKVADRFPCAYGVGGWPKQKEGDKKTPLGKYRITRTNFRPHPYRTFGPATLAIDYPNASDIYAEHTGAGIVIHGGRVASTHGCIRVLDGSLEKPVFGEDNILKLADLCPVNTTVFLTVNLKDGLVTDPGSFLDNTACELWAYLLDYELSNEDVLSRLQ